MNEINSIFEVWMVRDCNYGRPHYPVYKVEEIKMGTASSLSKAENIISEHVFEKPSRVHSYIVREIPVNKIWLNDTTLSCYVYDCDGTLLNERLYSTTLESPGQFYGRTPEQIRFKKGELVECYWCGVMCLGVVVGLPAGFGQKGRLDEMDDTYQIMVDYRGDVADCFCTDGDSIVFPNTIFVFKPRIKIKSATEKRLQNAYMKYLSRSV